MIFLLLLSIAVAMTTATYLSAIRRQKRNTISSVSIDTRY